MSATKCDLERKKTGLATFSLDTTMSIFTNVEFSNVDNKMSKTVVEFHWYLGRLQNIDFNGRIGKFGRFLNS